MVGCGPFFTSPHQFTSDPLFNQLINCAASATAVVVTVIRNSAVSSPSLGAGRPSEHAIACSGRDQGTPLLCPSRLHLAVLSADSLGAPVTADSIRGLPHPHHSNSPPSAPPSARPPAPLLLRPSLSPWPIRLTWYISYWIEACIVVLLLKPSSSTPMSSYEV
jgi:hypothetical protein